MAAHHFHPWYTFSMCNVRTHRHFKRRMLQRYVLGMATCTSKEKGKQMEKERTIVIERKRHFNWTASDKKKPNSFFAHTHTLTAVCTIFLYAEWFFLCASFDVKNWEEAYTKKYVEKCQRHIAIMCSDFFSSRLTIHADLRAFFFSANGEIEELSNFVRVRFGVCINSLRLQNVLAHTCVFVSYRSGRNVFHFTFIIFVYFFIWFRIATENVRMCAGEIC